MKSKERVLNAINRESVDRAPWVPFVGCHAGQLLGVSAEEYLKSSDLMFDGISKAIELYKPDGIPVCFDLQVEAEILGCDLTWAEENPPAVVSHPLSSGKKLGDLPEINSESGRLKSILDVTKKVRSGFPDLAVYGLITGPFTLALHLYGSDIFMEMFDHADYVKEIIGYCTEIGKVISKSYIDSGCDVIAIVDPMTSQIGPEQFKEFVTPYASSLFSYIRELGAKSSFFVCGHAQQNIESMCECRPDNISIDENIPLDFVRNMSEKYKISFGGNLQLTAVLLLGTPEDCQENAVNCMETGGDTGFILAPGCDIPYATPRENLESIIKVIEDPYQRDIIKALDKNRNMEILYNMRDYGQSDKVIVDIITLDSEACAPCQYMVESVKNITPEFEGIVEWREHKIKNRESLIFMTALMVRNIPTICIDGQITFVSQIPPKEQLIAAIQKRIIEKLRLKIQRKKKVVYILGDDKDKKFDSEINKAILELGEDIQVVNVTERENILSYGVLPEQTPAVVVGKYNLKTVRKLPATDVIKEWLKGE